MEKFPLLLLENDEAVLWNVCRPIIYLVETLDVNIKALVLKWSMCKLKGTGKIIW